MPKLDSSPSALAQIKTVAVIRPPEAKTYAVLDFGPHVASAFGLIGGLILASDQNSKQEKLTQALNDQHAAPSRALADDIAAQLTQRGFEAKVEDGPWVEKDGKFTIDLTKINSSADVVMVVTPTVVGFVLPGAGGSFLPTITANVTLLGRDRKETLYRGFHACGWHPGATGWKYLSTDVAFSDFDKVMEDPKKAASSLDGAATVVAASVAEDLKR